MIRTNRDSAAAGHTQTTLVSAVIINFNGGNCIINCLEALTNQNTPLEAVIVVDNGSTDGSPEQIKATFPDVQLIRLNSNRGLTVARNIGLQQAKTDLVLLLDDDVYVDKNCVHNLLETYHQSNAAVVCPRVILIPEGDIIQCDGAENHFIGTMLLRHGYQPLRSVTAKTTPVGSCIGACMLLHREKVLAAGAFYEAFFYSFEDLEFGIRMRGLGHQFVCNPAAVVYHDRGEGTPSLSFRGQGAYPRRRVYLQIRHRLMILLIHYQLRTLLILLPALALYEAAMFAVVLTKGWWKEWGRAWLSLLQNSDSIRRQRQQVQRSRCITDRDILVGGPIPFAPGFLRSKPAALAAKLLSTVLNSYWHITQRWIK